MRGATRFQVVFQFAAETLADFDLLIALGKQVEQVLTPPAYLDGHDFGQKEFNLFIHSDDPVGTFNLVAGAIQSTNRQMPFSAGYRSFVEDGYKPLWPENLKAFAVA